MNLDSIEIKELSVEHVSVLSKVLSKEKPAYMKHFTPFDFSVDSLKNVLTHANKDKFFGVFVSDKLAGFYMLRGFDDGFEIPSYGVWISSEFSNRGLSKLTLYHAFSFCKHNSIKILKLKVHPDNAVAKNLYESLGFIKIGFDDKNSNYIYHKSLTE
jgi:RimJ/RimL family protein N-acetyltransferase